MKSIKSKVFFAMAVLVMLTGFVFAQETPAEVAVIDAEVATTQNVAETADAEPTQSSSDVFKYLAAAIAVGAACFAGGIAVARIGAAAMGAMSENPELSGKALPFAGLAEGICLWGFLVALFILLV